MSQESSFWKDILEAVEEEEILCVVITSLLDSYYFGEEKDPRDVRVGPYIEKPLSPALASSLLDYAYDSGYGSRDCHFVYIYTKNKVYYVHEYDGSTSLVSLPRNPPKGKLL